MGWRELGLPPGNYHATEFWSGSYLGVSAEGAAVPLGPHGAAVVAIRAVADGPVLLSSSYHISQGGVEIAAWEYDVVTHRLRWSAVLGRRAVGAFLIAVPHDLIPTRLVSTAHTTHWRAQTGGRVLVSAEIIDRADFALELDAAHG
jgi:hypothetical protein